MTEQMSSPALNLRAHRDVRPTLGRDVYVDPQACVIGSVTLGDDCSVWPMAVVRGDVNHIEIGARTSVQDGAVLHVTHDGPYQSGGYPLLVGAEVTIGHRAILHGCTVGDRCLIGMGAIVLDGAIIEDEVMVGAGALVAPRTRLTRHGLWLGTPARCVRSLSAREIEALAYSAAHYVRVKDGYRGSTPAR